MNDPGDLDRYLDPAMGDTRLPGGNVHNPDGRRIGTRPRCRVGAPIQAEQPVQGRQETFSEKGDQLRLLGLEIAIPVVVDIPGHARAPVQKAIPEPTYQQQVVAGREVR